MGGSNGRREVKASILGRKRNGCKERWEISALMFFGPSGEYMEW